MDAEQTVIHHIGGTLLAGRLSHVGIVFQSDTHTLLNIAKYRQQEIF
jgi:hypothetical protein